MFCSSWSDILTHQSEQRINLFPDDVKAATKKNDEENEKIERAAD